MRAVPEYRSHGQENIRRRIFTADEACNATDVSSMHVQPPLRLPVKSRRAFLYLAIFLQR
jgi:hypothetical protein